MQCLLPTLLPALLLLLLLLLLPLLLQFIKGDIQSMDLLSFVLLTEQIDTIMHFAAQVRPGWQGQVHQNLVLSLSGAAAADRHRHAVPRVASMCSPMCVPAGCANKHTRLQAVLTAQA
jgi:nucleoside-diphosphate-sugar epimerase